MHHLQPLLEQIGFNHHESAIYLQLLQSGEQPASLLARQSKIPRSTVRGVLEKLCARGVVNKLYKRNTQYYRCEPPDSLLAHLQRRIADDHDSMRAIEETLPQLKAMHRKDGVIP